jgi:hypothetical protein
MSGDQNARQVHKIKRNKFCETVNQFKFFGTTLTDKNPIHEDIKSKLKAGMFPVADYIVFLVFPSVLSFLQERVLEGIYYSRCDQSS